MSRPYCLVCKVSTNETDKVYNIELDHTRCTKTLLRKFLNDLLDYAIKFTTLNVCSTCFHQINELDILQNRTEAARRKLQNYFSSDVAVQKERFKHEPVREIKIEVYDSLKNGDDDDEDIANLLDFEDDEDDTTKDDTVYEIENDIDGFGDPNSDGEPEQENENETTRPRRKASKTKSPDESPRKRKRDSDTPKYECSECKEIFKTKSELKTHSMSEHSTVKPFVCEICGAGYRNKSGFDVHIGMHNGIHPFTCPHCNKTFTQKGSLQRHLNMHTGETPFQCDLCGKRFIHHSSFKVHQMHHSGQKDHKCNICNLALMTGSHLRRHMRVHTGEKRYSCEICGKRFAERYNYAVHQKVHEKHGASAKKPMDKSSLDNVTTEGELESDKKSLDQLDHNQEQQQEYYEGTDFTITPLYAAHQAESITVVSAPLQKINATQYSPAPTVQRIVTPAVPIWNFNT